MKKMIVAFLMMPSLFFSLVQEQALAQDCIQTKPDERKFLNLIFLGT